MSDISSEPLNPYAPPQVPVGELQRNYPGIGRLAFALSCVAVVVVVNLLRIVNQNYIGPAAPIAMIVFLLLVGLRLMNIGRRIVMCMLMLVPLVNLFILGTCLALPPGYEDHRILDASGKIVRGILVGLLVLLAMATFASNFL